MPKKKPNEAVEEPFEKELPQEEPVDYGLMAESKLPEPEEQEKKETEPVRKDEIGKVFSTPEGNFIETLIRYAEARDLPDEDLPDIMKLLGAEDIDPEETAEPRKYQTVVNNSTMGTNLIIYPAIPAGRCEICGSTRFVDKKNGSRGEVWRVVNKKTGEYTHSYRRGNWVEMHAANCPHYRHVDIRCAYCNEGFTGQKDNRGSFTEVLASRIIYVFAERTRPNSLIMVCSDMRCKSKFDHEYHLNQTV